MESYSIGRVFSRAFELVKGTLASVGLFVLLIQLVNMALQWALRQSIAIPAINPASPKDPFAALAIFQSGWYWLVVLVSLVLASFTYAGSISGMLTYADRGKANLADCLSAGLAKMLPMLGLLFLWYLGVAAGWLLLVIPGIILITMWSAAMPVLMGEDLGVFASFGRSRNLTRGLRMNIFVTLLLFLIVIYVVLIGVILSAFGTNMMQFAAQAAQSPMLFLVMIPVGWLSSMALYSLVASIYLEAVLVKEGGRSAHLVDVFD